MTLVVDETGTIVAGDPGSILARTVVINSASDTASTLGQRILETPEVQPGQSIVKRALGGKGTALIEAVTTNSDDSTRYTAWDLTTKLQTFSFVRSAYPRNLMVLPDGDTLIAEDKHGLEIWSLSRKKQLYQLEQAAAAAYVSYDSGDKATVRTICTTNVSRVDCSATALTVTSDGIVTVATKTLPDFGSPVIGSHYIAVAHDILGTEWLSDWKRGTSVPLDYILIDSEGTPFRRVRKGPNNFGLVNAVTNVEFIGSWNSLTLPSITTRTLDPTGTRYLALTSNGEVLAWSAKDGHFLYSLSVESSRISALTFSPDGYRLFTRDDSGGVRIWDIDSWHYLATYFPFGNKDWALVDDKQHFAATKAAELRIGYRIGLTAIPFEQFDVTHNRPDMVMQEIGLATKDDLDAARESVSRRLERLGIPSAVDQSLSSLPVVDIQLGPIPRTASDNVVSLSVIAHSEHAILDRLNVVGNGVPVFRAAGIRLSSKSVSKIVAIPLVFGLNEMSLILRKLLPSA